jgi:hypothetical protein
LSEYHYKEPDDDDLNDFILENKAGESNIKLLFIKFGRFFTQSKFFEHLFPPIKEEKPGKDFYAPMAGVQLLIIVFMIFFYTRMDPDYTNISSQSLTPNQMNNIMIVAIFLQIAFIVLDRYIYLSRDFVVIDHVELEEDDSDDDLSELAPGSSFSVDFQRQQSIDIRSSSGGNLLSKGFGLEKKTKPKNDKLLDTSKGGVLEDIEDDDNGEEDFDDQDVVLSKTNFNRTMVLKFYLQLFLLILVHGITFWYFPIKANINLQVTAYCDYSDEITGSKCNEVFMNWTLIIFYLLYCIYFTVS